MFKKLLTSACLCFIALWAGTATAREITFDLLSDKGPATHKSWPGKHLLLALATPPARKSVPPRSMNSPKQ